MLFTLLLIINSYFLTSAVNAQIINPIADLAMATGTRTNEANVEMKLTH